VLLKEQRLPYRYDLDRAAPNHAVVVVRGVTNTFSIQPRLKNGTSRQRRLNAKAVVSEGTRTDH
jgi:hypothetical protein